jgi:hypothetical protein
MINIKDQLPSVYYDASRDFQVLGHLYEVVLNYVKTNADMLYLLPNGIEEDTRATELLATTLGFKLRRNYDKAQLAALVSIFPQLLKVKGTKKAIDLAGYALVKASGVPGTFDSHIDKESHVLTVRIPIELSDITLFMDLLPYILPFGIRVSVIRNTVEHEKVSTSIGTTANLRKALPGYGPLAQQPLGLAKVELSDKGVTSIAYSNSNFTSTIQDKSIDSTSNDAAITYEANAGLLGATPIIAFETENSIITFEDDNNSTESSSIENEEENL